MVASGMRGKHLLTCDDWTKQEIDTILAVAKDLKLKFALGDPHRLLIDQTIFMMFFEQSTRTRNSIEAGITQLGGHAHDLTPDKMQLSHGESAKDTAMVLSRMGHAMACRNCFFNIGNNYLNELASWSSIPVISMQDDIYHPLQALADLMTMQEHFGENLHGLKVTISWAYAKSHAKPLSVPQSQVLLFTRYGMDVTLAMPKEFPLSRKVMHKARNNAQVGNGKIKITHDMNEAFKGANVVIPKNWGGFASFDEFIDDDEHRNEMKDNLEKNKDWICDLDKLSLSDFNVKYMHALPADRGNEVTDDVIDGPNSIVYDEAENRLHTTKALMALIMGR